MSRVVYDKRYSTPASVLLRVWSGRFLLLALTLIAFGRVVWSLDAKNLTWDESLSLQRAESDWPELLVGRIVISDGHNQAPTIDQHPFAFFALLGLFVRLVGQSEFGLRLPSAMAATLLVPMVWAFARRLIRHGILPLSTASWAALLTAVSPFYLWFGQEARPYMLWAFLALLSTYLLVRWATAPYVGDARSRRNYGIAYSVSLVVLLGSHYFSIFLLPVQALVVIWGLRARSRHLAFLAAGGLLIVGLAMGLIPAWLILKQPGAGTNFNSISLRILIPDLTNAFSLGLSVDITQVFWLDLIFAATALVGLIGALRSRRVVLGGGWLLLAFVVVPVVLLLLVNVFRPLYMTARHMSMISGVFLLLVAAGMGWVWDRSRWAGGAVAAVMLAGMVYSSANYFTQPKYGKNDIASLGDTLRSQLQAGDLVLLQPPHGLRLLRYYLPLDAVERGAQAGLGTGWEAVPPLDSTDTELRNKLEQLSAQYRRIWMVRSGLPGGSPKKIIDWLEANAFRVRDYGFYSPVSIVRLMLYLPTRPILKELPKNVQHPLDVVFGPLPGVSQDRVRLSGYDIGRPLARGAPIPVTLYWQAPGVVERRYKYILRLEELPGPSATLQQAQIDGYGKTLAGGPLRARSISITEREPYDGALPTTEWPPGRTVVEYSEVAAPDSLAETSEAGGEGRYRLVIQMYDAESLAKLPIMHAGGVEVEADGETLVLPYAP